VRRKIEWTVVTAVGAGLVLLVVAVLRPSLFSYIASALAVVISTLSVYATVEDQPDLKVKEVRPRAGQVNVVVANAPDSGKARGCQAKVDVECTREDFLPLGHQGGLLLFLNQENAPPGGIRSSSIVWARSPPRDLIDINPDDEETLVVARVARIPEPVIVIFSEEGDAGTIAGPIRSRGRALLRARDTPYTVTVRVGSDNLPRRVECKFLMSVNATGDGFQIGVAPK
jgi:hypothetical protein